MDQEELKDWVDFCEGRVSHDSARFSQVFLGMFAEPLQEQDKSDLRKMFSYLPNSSRVLEFLLQMGTRAADRSEEEIVNLVSQDLNEMRRIMTDPGVLAAMELGVSEVVRDRERFQQSRTSLLNREFIQAIGDYFREEVYRRSGNKKIAVIHDSFYGIANDLHLKYALTASLLGSNINCGHYLELYKLGADYSLDEKGALVLIYRK